MQTLVAIDIFLYSKYGISSLSDLLLSYTKEFESLIIHPDVQVAYINYVQNQLDLHQFLIKQCPISHNGIVHFNPEISSSLVKRLELITKMHETIHRNTEHMLIEFDHRLTDNDKKTLREAADIVLKHKYNILYEIRDRHVLECIRSGVEPQYWNFYKSSIVEAFEDLGVSNIFKINPWLIITTQGDFVIDPNFTYAKRIGYNFNIRSLDLHTSRIENWDSKNGRPLLTYLKLDGVSYKSVKGSIFTDEYGNTYPQSQTEDTVVENTPEPEKSLWQKVMESKEELGKSKTKVYAKLINTSDSSIIAKYNNPSELDLLKNKSGVEYNLVRTDYLRDKPIDETRMLPPSNDSK